jgi:hypothetical protein
LIGFFPERIKCIGDWHPKNKMEWKPGTSVS